MVRARATKNGLAVFLTAAAAALFGAAMMVLSSQGSNPGSPDTGETRLAHPLVYQAAS